jgi:hypothetical protein
MVTAKQVITDALRLYGIIDQTEDAQGADISNNVSVLNDILRNEHSDGACQYTMKLATVTLPQGAPGQIYTFTVGTGRPDYLVQLDAVAIKSIWLNDINLTVNRETRMAPMADVIRTLQPGIITKWNPRRQIDGSVLVTAWQPPRTAVQAVIEYGERMPALTAADGSDVVQLPPEGVLDIKLLLGLTVCGSYGRPSDKLDPVLLSRAQTVNARWRDWARGQQWLRFVRN